MKERKHLVAGYVKNALLWKNRNPEEMIAYNRFYFEEQLADQDNMELVDVYVDVTGHKETYRRPEMVRLLKDVTKGKVNALPEEYVDRKTGELKKRIKVYYPEKYEGRIGNYYHDYIATEQMNLFENLNEYDGGGNMQNGDNEAERNINQPSQFQNVTASGGELNE